MIKWKYWYVIVKKIKYRDILHIKYIIVVN
jgi:hypothetical protein